MYFYEVGYSSYEEAPTYTLMSEKEYTQKQFDELVADCMIEAYFLETSKHQKRMIDEGIVERNVDDEDDEELYDYHAKVDHLLSPAIDILVNVHGFSQPEFLCRFQPFGWASIKDPEDWKGDTDSQLNTIRERFKIHDRDKRIDGINK